MIDSDGFRPNVGIILANHRGGEVLWARRIGQDSWQFPQGGIKHNETPPEDALYRELGEEIGLCASDVEIISCTRGGWLRYRFRGGWYAITRTPPYAWGGKNRNGSC